MAKKEKENGFFSEFKKFISRGSIVDMAVGIIIGGAFTAIVNSLVNDVLMPLIALVKKGGFSDMYFGILPEGVAPEGGVTLANGAVIAEGGQLYRTYIYYGNFIQAIINFLLIALTLFCVIRTINKVRERAEAAKAKIMENKKEEAEEVSE